MILIGNHFLADLPKSHLLETIDRRIVRRFSFAIIAELRLPNELEGFALGIPKRFSLADFLIEVNTSVAFTDSKTKTELS